MKKSCQGQVRYYFLLQHVAVACPVPVEITTIPRREGSVSVFFLLGEPETQNTAA